MFRRFMSGTPAPEGGAPSPPEMQSWVFVEAAASCDPALILDRRD